MVSACLKGKIEIKEFYCDGAMSRMQNVKMAGKAASEINHITGDVNFLALGLKGRKNIITMHDFGHYENLKKQSWIRFVSFKLFWFQLPLRHVDIVTVVSNFTRKKLIDYLGYPEERIRVIHDPVKPVFRPSPKTELNKTPRILQIGTGPHKNLKNLIEAVKNTDVHLDIVAYPNENELAALKASNVSYTIHNNLTDEQIFERYQDCDVLFFASFHEGFGMPIIEAQSVGRPVVTSNLGAMKEVAGDSALLVNPDKPEEIKDAIFKLLTNSELYKEMVTRGTKNIIPFRHDVIAQQYLDVYNELSKMEKRK